MRAARTLGTNTAGNTGGRGGNAGRNAERLTKKSIFISFCGAVLVPLRLWLHILNCPRRPRHSAAGRPRGCACGRCGKPGAGAEKQRRRQRRHREGSKVQRTMKMTHQSARAEMARIRARAPPSEPWA